MSDKDTEGPDLPRGAQPADLSRLGIGLGTQQDASEFAQRILDRAAHLGMNKAQLATKAKLVRQTLDNLLQFASQGEAAMPSIRTFIELGQALKVHPAWLIEGLFSNMVMPARIDIAMRRERSPGVEDLNYPEGAVVAPGSYFGKGWRVTNLSGQAWSGLRLVCQDARVAFRSKRTGQELFAGMCMTPDALELPVPDLAAGESAELWMGFRAHLHSGVVVSRWLAVDADGQLPPPHARFGVWTLVHVTTLADTLAFEPLPD